MSGFDGKCHRLMENVDVSWRMPGFIENSEGSIVVSVTYFGVFHINCWLILVDVG